MNRRTLFAAFLAAAFMSGPAPAEDSSVIDARVSIAEQTMFAQIPGTRELMAQAKGVLVMPEVVKGGFILGGAYGEGALKVNGATVGYYSVAAASIGLQVGVQKTSHALFFMTDGALERFRRADGWTIGADAEATVLDKGVNIGVDSASLQKPVVAVVFGGDGLLIGASLEGAKYSPIAR